MQRWVVTVLVIDAILLPIAVVLILLGVLWAGIAVVVIDAVIVSFYVLRHVRGDVQRNAELSASGVPGKSGGQQGTEARIFEE